MKYLIRMKNAFITSIAISLIVLLVMELISYSVGGQVRAMTPEFRAYFPSETIAFGVDLLLYGIIGITFSGMSFIYDVDKIGILLQNLIYYLGTSVIWVPLVTFIWQLQKYPQALWCTIGGFLVTEIIMTVVGIRSTKADVLAINKALHPNK